MSCECEKGKCEHCLSLESAVEDLDHDITVLREYLREVTEGISNLDELFGAGWKAEVEAYLDGEAPYDVEVELDEVEEEPIEIMEAT